MTNHSFSDLKDKVCVITGGAGVIGTAIVKVLASAGVKTIILDLRKEVAEELARRSVARKPEPNVSDWKAMYLTRIS